MIPKNRRPSHPGEILLELYLKPSGMSQLELARRMGVPIQRVNTLINGKLDMSPETAILLSKVLKTSSQYWIILQMNWGPHDAQIFPYHAA